MLSIGGNLETVVCRTERNAYMLPNDVVERVTIRDGSVTAVWHTPQWAPSILYQLDMGKSWYATIHADYRRA
jgi:hypothetical protein